MSMNNRRLDDHRDRSFGALPSEPTDIQSLLRDVNNALVQIEGATTTLAELVDQEHFDGSKPLGLTAADLRVARLATGVLTTVSESSRSAFAALIAMFEAEPVTSTPARDAENLQP